VFASGLWSHVAVRLERTFDDLVGSTGRAA
jgi:hypothetical protein